MLRAKARAEGGGWFLLKELHLMRRRLDKVNRANGSSVEFLMELLNFSTFCPHSGIVSASQTTDLSEKSGPATRIFQTLDGITFPDRVRAFLRGGKPGTDRGFRQQESRDRSSNGVFTHIFKVRETR